MQYSQARQQIKSGDLLAWTHRPWSSWYDFKIQMVRVFTRSEYCHVGVAWVSAGRVWVIEAVTPKVRVYPLSKLLPFYLLPLPVEPWTREHEERALDPVGDDYSQWQAIVAIASRPARDNLWQCAELADMIARVGGIDLGTDITPKGLVRAAQTLGVPTYWIDK